MAILTVRNLPEETHRALRVRAAHHNRSTEAEVRAILEEAVRPAERVLIGSELAAFASQWGGLDIDLTRDQQPMRGAAFE
jgi:antitoxin FitA